ncbi:hypothetical protein SGRA_2099 [Saprospira grandis str. Lewin]|uniref:Uncharacterized protein n=1 Tax=Saprospira grandis (strain Lewin) TaxID=984262 RepID=H6L2S3_SAPGL|nr:hypothetical protein SGRA_2099 [Saprospira grandis str. Lewin]
MGPLIFLGPAASKAGRRYAAGLTGLFGPAAAFGGFGLALRATPPQRWANWARPSLESKRWTLLSFFILTADKINSKLAFILL